MKPTLFSLILAGTLSAAQASVIVTTDADAVRDFQRGLTVQTFEDVLGRQPQPLAQYVTGVELAEPAEVYDQIAGVRFSVGGTVGVNQPALYELRGQIGADARSPQTVLGTVDFDRLTLFNDFGLMELFFPTKVTAAGFWLNPSLGGATVYAVNTLFAFSNEEETILESAIVEPGGFVGFSFDTARIGGLKVLGRGVPDPELPGSRIGVGFTIDDLSYASSTRSVPVPATVWLLACALPLVGPTRRRWPTR